MRNQGENIPHMELIEGSEVLGEIDTSAMGIDGSFKPIILSSADGAWEWGITVEDARRLKEFLDGAIIYLEDGMQ